MVLLLRQGSRFPPPDQFCQNLHRRPKLFRIGERCALTRLSLQPCETDACSGAGDAPPSFSRRYRQISGVDRTDNLTVPLDGAGELVHAKGTQSLKLLASEGFSIGVVLAVKAAGQPLRRGFCRRAEIRAVDQMICRQVHRPQPAQIADRKMCAAGPFKKADHLPQRQLFHMTTP